MSFQEWNTNTVGFDGKVALVDMDGTIIETDFANFLSYNEAVYKVLTAPIPEFPLQRVNREYVHNVFSNMTDEQFASICTYKEQRYPHHLQQTKLNIRLISTLMLLKQNGWHIYLVSKSRRERAFITLVHHNVLALFDGFYNLPCSNNKYAEVIKTLHIEDSTLETYVFDNEEKECLNALHCGIPMNNIYKVIL